MYMPKVLSTAWLIAIASATPLAQASTNAVNCTMQLASPLPIQYACGAQGTLSSPQRLSRTVVDDFNTCRDSCLNRTDCVLFSFTTARPPGQATHTCRLFSAPLHDMGYAPHLKPNPYGFFYYSRHCFVRVCSTVPPTPKPSKPFALRLFGSFTPLDSNYATTAPGPGNTPPDFLTYALNFSAADAADAASFVLEKDGSLVYTNANGTDYVAAVPVDAEGGVGTVAFRRPNTTLTVPLVCRGLAGPQTNMVAAGGGNIVCKSPDGAWNVLQVQEGGSLLELGKVLGPGAAMAQLWAF